MTQEQIAFIIRVGRRGLPVTEASADDHKMARDLITEGRMFIWWKCQIVDRYTPTREAFAEAQRIIEGQNP